MADFVDMQSISKVNIGFRFSFCVTDIFSKYAWVTSLKNAKESKLLMFLKKNLAESNRKPNKIRLNKGSEF